MREMWTKYAFSLSECVICLAFVQAFDFHLKMDKEEVRE